MRNPETRAMRADPIFSHTMKSPSAGTGRYLEHVEAALSSQERERVEKFLQGIIYSDEGSVRDYDDIAKSIFSLREDPDMAELEAKLDKRIYLRLRDYLLTKVDVLLNRDLRKAEDSFSGVFPIATGFQESRVATGTTLPIEKRREDQESVRGHIVEEGNHQDISQMSLEALLSKQIIGVIDPPTFCQSNYDFCIPRPDGFTFFSEGPMAPRAPRHVPQMNWDLVEENDIVFELPTSRIQGHVLPVPENHQVIGVMEQSLEIVDPDESNPFCTRFVGELVKSKVTYVVRRVAQSVQIDGRHFSPSADQPQELAECLPLPEDVRVRGRMNIHAAYQAIGEYMAHSFLYVCDDRLGAFIKRHPDELGTLMDGLRVGHCDLLAWSAAAYFRQLGYTAFVVNTEVTDKEGQGFMRDMTHSRVAIIKEDGSRMYFDPTSKCRVVKGYALRHIDDEEILRLEKDFVLAEGPTEKKAVLQVFSKLIHEVETCDFEVPEIQENGPNRIDDTPCLLEGIFVTNDDMLRLRESVFTWFEKPLSEDTKREMNKLMDILAAHRISLMRNALPFLEVADVLSQDIRHMQSVVERIGPSALITERATRNLFPDVADIAHAQITNKQRFQHEYERRQEVTYCQLFRAEAASYLPKPETLRIRSLSFDPSYSYLQDGKYFEYDISERAIFAKLMATALIDEDTKLFVKTMFGLDDAFLKLVAEDFEPRASANAQPKKVTSSLELYSGKRTKADYDLFCHRAKMTSATLMVDPMEHEMALKSFLSMLSRLPLRSQHAKEKSLQRTKNPFDITEEEYDSRRHSADMINEEASAKKGMLMVRNQPWTEAKETILYVDIDTDVGPGYPVLESFARLRVVLEGLMTYARVKRVSIRISSRDNDYFMIEPDSKISLDILLFRLASPRFDRLDEERPYGFRANREFPKNLLYLSANQAKINAMKYTLGKQTNLMTRSFSEMGLDIFPRFRLKQSEAKNASTENE